MPFTLSDREVLSLILFGKSRFPRRHKIWARGTNLPEILFVRPAMRPFLARTLALAACLSLFMPPALAARFVDLSGNWTEKYVNLLSDEGVISAEDDGKFKPDKPVTRAVLADWLVKVLHLDSQPIGSTPSFPDVRPADWFYKAVEIIRQNNYIAGYADGFRPNQFIQRAEVITILSRTLSTPTPGASEIQEVLSKYKDGDKVPDWAKTGVSKASLAGIVLTEKEDMLDPSALASRADAAALLYGLEQYITKQTIAQSENQAPPAQAQAQPGSDWQQRPPNYASSQPAGSAYPPAGYPPPVQRAYPPPPAYGDYPPPGGAYGSPNYTGRVTEQGQYPPPLSYGGQTSAYPPPGYGQPPPNYLQGAVAVVAAGTHFRAALRNSLDSGSTQPGEEVTATLSEPLTSNGAEVVPAGSRLVGNVTNVVSAKRFRAGANGKVDIRFTAIETPDGRRFPLSASVDTTQQRLTGGSGAGRVGKGLATMGIGAAGGAALGTALGAIVGGTSNSQNMGRSVGMGAVFGTALGAGVGGVGAVVRKGSEVKIPAGTPLPVQLDESLQVTIGRAVNNPYPPPPGYGYAPPVQQPQGYFPPQQ
jgi:hypothetical protein